MSGISDKWVEVFPLRAERRDSWLVGRLDESESVKSYGKVEFNGFVKHLAHNNRQHATLHALSVCVYGRKLPWSNTNGQRMQCACAGRYAKKVRVERVAKVARLSIQAYQRTE